MSYPYRCRKCRARRSFKQKLWPNEKPPKCKVCGNREYVLDIYRLIKENKNPCRCDGLWFPHRRGCKRCNYRDFGFIMKDELGGVTIMKKKEIPF